MMKRLLIALVLLVPVLGHAQIRRQTAVGTISAGGSTSTARIGGVLYATTTAVASTGALDNTLLTYSLPANTLDAAGRGIRITVWGVTAADGDNKLIELYWAGDAIVQSANSGWNNQGWLIRFEIYKVSSNLQTGFGTIGISSAGGNITWRQYVYSAAGGILNEADTAAIAISVHADGDNDNDVVLQGFTVEMLN